MRNRTVWVGALAATAIGLVPIWPHAVLVSSGLDGIIAVFREVAIYPSDVCLALLTGFAVTRPVSLDSASRWVALGLTLLATTVLLSAAPAADPALAAGLAAQLALLSLAWMALRSLHVARSVLATTLVASAVVQSALAGAQFLTQQVVVPAQVGLPWLPSDGAQAGAPVILDPAGDRLLRGFGTFPHPNVLGGYLAITIVCLPPIHHRWPRTAPLLWLAGGILAIGLVASFSRAAWLAALVGLGLTWWTGARNRRSQRWFPILIGGAALVGVGLTPLAPLMQPRLFPFGPTGNALERGSIQNRLALDETALLEVAEHWPGGVGGANDGLASVNEGYQEGWGEPAPNLVLLIVAELGLAGFLALTVLVLAMARLTWLETGMGSVVMASFVTMMVLAMFDHYLWTMPLGRVMAWIPFALAAARDRSQPK